MISGMSAASFAEQLVAAERMSKDALFKNNLDNSKAQIDAYKILERTLNKMTSNLDNLNGDAFEGKTSEISDDSATITVDSDAPAGVYDLYVKQLAQAHQITKSFTSEDEILPTTGVVSIDVGGNSIDIDMAELNASGNATVSDLRDAINKHPDNPGVTASLVRTGGQVELMLTSDETGKDSTVTMEMNGTDWGTQERIKAQDAEFTLNGIDITSSSNYLDNVIDGVNIELKKAHNVGESATITIGNDTEGTEKAVNDFVDSFNELMTQLNQLTRSMGSSVLDDINGDKDKDDDDEDDDDDENSSVGEDQIGILKGDSSLRMLQNSVRNAIFDEAPNGMRLSDIGIEMGRDGKLSVDDEKLSQAISSDSESIKEMFTADGGYIDRIDSIIDPFTKNNGYIDLKQKNLDSQVEQIEDNMSRHDNHMSQRYQILLTQFTAMENTINKLNTASGLF
ncbi:flagellar hook protein FliD [Shewanella sp. UCD-FRSSP16_17]|uniref:flagellar filament capping protein FliD n=1 Tax=Shewanella sp. UCD-FRSSP16_17 TaxID=1853256 RepID=UPI0007EEC161|nr:flagellar filament capping protein FliD [Shewanella sp. UCD-FRSSP16_17]OBT05329.1 flagellar hook protein FliD [Shewanella sp. UCD-FRSSP16_17]